MKLRTDRNSSGNQRPNHVQGERLNWVFVAGGALLSTLSITVGYKVKQILDARKPVNANHELKGTEINGSKRSAAVFPLHSNMDCCKKIEDECYNCRAGISEGMVEINQSQYIPLAKDSNLLLPLVTVPAPETHKESNMMWASSPECVGKRGYQSSCSDSPCLSESGSDFYNKREVIQKLHQQLKKRDEMILEMQGQIIDLQNSLSTQISHSTHLESQVESINQELFRSEREMQRMRKVIANHCVNEMDSPEKTMSTKNWHNDTSNGHVNGFPDEASKFETRFASVEMGRDDSYRYDMLKKEMVELREVIEGKEFLLQSY